MGLIDDIRRAQMLAAEKAVVDSLPAELRGITARPEPSEAVRDVLAERRRQVEVEGWTPEHDDQHAFEEMALAAACYANADPDDPPPPSWPWHPSWWKPRDRRRNLIRAAALLLAEIERIDRAAMAEGAR